MQTVLDGIMLEIIHNFTYLESKITNYERKKTIQTQKLNNNYG